MEKEFRLKKLIGSAAIILSVYLLLKYILPLVLPFVFGGLIALSLYPFVRKLCERLKLNKSFLTSILLLIALAFFIFLSWLFLCKLFEQIRNLIQNMAHYEAKLYSILNSCCCQLENLLGIEASVTEKMLRTNINSFTNNLSSNFVPDLLGKSISYLKYFIGFFGLLVITFISTILFIKDFEKIKNSLGHISCYEFIHSLWKRILTVGGTYLRAQLIIMLLISIVCTISLFLLGNPYALLVGTGIGLLDALPFFGTGSVFVPWAMISFVQGDFFHAAAYLTLYLITSLMREFLEPKLIGDKLGIPPIFVLAAIYAGLHLFGLGGILLGPLFFLLSYELLAFQHAA